MSRKASETPEPVTSGNISLSRLRKLDRLSLPGVAEVATAAVTVTVVALLYCIYSPQSELLRMAMLFLAALTIIARTQLMTLYAYGPLLVTSYGVRDFYLSAADIAFVRLGASIGPMQLLTIGHRKRVFGIEWTKSARTLIMKSASQKVLERVLNTES